MGETVKVTLRLSREARRGLERASEANGVTLTALAEAIGLVLDEGGGIPQTERGLAVIARARAIDLERRQRRW